MKNPYLENFIKIDGELTDKYYQFIKRLFKNATYDITQINRPKYFYIIDVLCLSSFVVFIISLIVFGLTLK